MANMAMHQSQATGYCINQTTQPAKQPMNRRLKNTAQARELAQNLRENAKLPAISIEGTLWIYRDKKKGAVGALCFASHL
jgi:hypothetical protein